MKILFVNTGPLGDVILCRELLRGLRRQYPGCALDAWVQPTYGPLLVAMGLADRAAVYGMVLEGGKFVRRMDYDLCVDCLPQPLEATQAAQRVRCRPDFQPGTSALEQYAATLQTSAGTSAATLRVAPVLGNEWWTALHPVGTWSKAWPRARWVAVAQALAKKTKVLLLCGPADVAPAMAVARALPEGSFFLCDRKPLVELAGRLQGCRYFIGGETGITHLAQALGVPGAALWTREMSHWLSTGTMTPLWHSLRQPQEVTVEQMLAAIPS